MGLNTLIFLKDYNNYFNRIVKKYDEIQDYIDNYEYSTKTNINFVPGDGIDTKQITNWNESWMPDYVLIVSGSEIVSRWFIIESFRELTGQYNMTLKRDVIADNLENILTAPCYVEKATLTSDNPLIYNSEGGSYNQIKKKEYLLKDYTNSAWLVGYTARPASSETSIPTEISIKAERKADFIWDETRFPKPGEIKTVYQRIGTSKLKINYAAINATLFIEDWIFPTEYDIYENLVNDYTYGNGYIFLKEDNIKVKYTLNPDDYYLDLKVDTAIGAAIKTGDVINKIKDCSKIITQNSEAILNAIKSSYPLYFAQKSEYINEILSYDGKTVEYVDEGGNVFNYVVKITKRETDKVYNETLYKNQSVGTLIQSVFPIDDENYTKTIKGEPFSLSFLASQYDISLVSYTEGTFNIPISSERRTLEDAPYDMFCIPYNDMPIYNGNTKLFDNNQEMSLRFAQGMVEKLSNNIVYDLQLLPYCPIAGLTITLNKGIDISDLEENHDYNLITKTELEDTINTGIIFWASVSNGTFNIPFSYTVKEMKIENECDLWRLCSPNFNGMFDFSAAKNNGFDYFNVDWTYKPYTPYIHISPNFKGLYGSDFNDSRGLICGGDFSVATAVSKFAEYEVQNKNYQNIFDRNIQNMDKMHEYDLMKQSLGIVGSTVGGAVAGGLKGGIPGAIVGGIAGATTSGINMGLNIAKYKEQRSYEIDQFNYKLGSIQALPMSLTKSSALTYNNKIWPILEYYTATDVEKEALRNKIKYNGMSVMVIGKMEDYRYIEPQFFQGQMIRLENLADDSHIAYAIYDEIKKGVYI